MPTPQASDIGPVFDVLLATRDGSTLPCKNSQGQTLNLSKVAYMTSIDRNNQQLEETELAHKDRLIQLSSPNLIDREFEQWPQVTQGDWSGGGLQRVFTGATPITGGVESDPTRFWDGIPGLIWPLVDYLPMRPFRSAPLGAGTGTLAKWVNPALTGTGNVGCIGGFLGSNVSAAAPGEGFLVAEATTGASPFEVTFWSNGTSWNATAGAGSQLIMDITTDPRGGLWWVNSPDGVALNVYSGYAGAANSIVITQQDTLVATLSSSTVANVRMASGSVGNVAVIAVAWTALPSVGGWVNSIRLYILGSAGPSITNLNLPTIGSTSFTGPAGIITSMCFLGDQLVFCISDNSLFGVTVPASGTSSTIVSYNISSATFSTLAHIQGTPNALVGTVSGTVFIVSQSLDLFLLQGSSLQYVATLPPPTSIATGNFSWSISRPTSFGPYAIFGVAYQLISNTNMDIYAYDASRGRLFKVETLSYSGVNQLPQPGFQIGVFSFWQKSSTPAFNAYFNIAVPVDDISGQTQAVQILHFGVLAQGVTTPLPMQQGTDIVSSLIDFTAASTKLYRQVVADFTALTVDTLASVRIKVWLDQDPNSLTVFPDFDTGAVNGSGNPGIKTLALPINKMAKKLVYEVITTGGTPNVSNTWIPAPRLQSISIQAATGWTRTMFLDIANNVGVNSKTVGETCWAHQSAPGQPALDGEAAYNFLRQLWRLKGGQCIATFPNLDPAGNWLLQDVHFTSPKPYGTSFRADMLSGLSYVCQVKLREDV